MKMTLRPRSWVSWSFVLEDSEGREVRVRMGRLRERAELAVDGVTYSVRRSGWGRLEMRAGDEVVATAARPGAFSRRWHLELADEELELVPAGLFTRAFELRRRRRVVGRVRPDGPLTRRATVELPDELSPAERAFVAVVAVLSWRRAAAMTAAGGS